MIKTLESTHVESCIVNVLEDDRQASRCESLVELKSAESAASVGLLKSSDGEVPATHWSTLSRATGGNPVAIQFLTETFRRGDASERCAAIKELGGLAHKNPTAVPYVTRAMNDGGTSVRIEAIKQTVSLIPMYPSVMRHLVTSLKDEDVGVRRVALRAALKHFYSAMMTDSLLVAMIYASFRGLRDRAICRVFRSKSIVNDA